MRTLFLRKPTPEILSRFLAEQSALDFNYQNIGATSTTPPADFILDRTRIELGEGESVFQAAKTALQHWRQFRLGWVDVWPPRTPLRAGNAVVIMAEVLGFWWLNCCRIVHTMDEPGLVTKFGFAYGTLPGHVQRGEEQFLIEWDQSTDRVVYDILAFSKPNSLLTRLGYPLVRYHQKRFGRDSAASMFRAVNAASTIPSVCQSTG